MSCGSIDELIYASWRVLKSRLLHTSEILASDARKTLFEQLRETFDYVIVDLSPLAPVVDVRATKAGGFVCLLSNGAAPKSIW